MIGVKQNQADINSWHYYECCCENWKNESVQLEVLLKICEALNCTIDSIVEITPNMEADPLSSPKDMI